jgi:cyclophilin family peptidyl-prolyl cis-trans isomerase
MVRKFSISLLLAAVVFTAGCKDRGNEVSERLADERAAGEELKKMESMPKKVKLETSKGDIIIELYEEKAPVTVANFLRYVEEGFYDGTIFHRVISGFMVQGGGFTVDMQRKQTHGTIVNEAKNGLKNNRGSISMARTNNPDSAASQFFINHKDNDNLNYAGEHSPGYAVFGAVVEGMDVVDAIAAAKTTSRNGMRDVPVEPIVVESAKVVSVR